MKKIILVALVLLSIGCRRKIYFPDSSIRYIELYERSKPVAGHAFIGYSYIMLNTREKSYTMITKSTLTGWYEERNDTIYLHPLVMYDPLTPVSTITKSDDGPRMLIRRRGEKIDAVYNDSFKVQYKSITTSVY